MKKKTPFFSTELYLKWIADNPKKSLLLSATLILLLLPGLMNIRTDYGVRVWFQQDDPALVNFDFTLDTFGNDDTAILVLDNKNGIFNQETLSDIRSITEELWSVPDVIRVDSLANFNHISSTKDEVHIEELIPLDLSLNSSSIAHIKKIATTHKTIPGTIVSRDKKSTIFMAKLTPLFGEQPNHAPIMKKIDSIIKKYNKNGHYTFHKFGTATVTETFRVIAENDLMLMLPLLNFLIFIILIFLFKRPMGVIVPFTIIGLSIAGAMGISGYFGVRLNNLSAMVPTILIAIAIADSIHIIVTYYNLSHHQGNQALETLKKNFAPTFLTSFSTSLAFASLGTASLIPIQNFGYLCAAGTLLAWIFSILTIVPMLELFDTHKKSTSNHKKTLPYSTELVDFIIKNPYKIIITFILIATSAIFLALKNEVNSNPFNYFSKTTDLYESNQHILKTYGGLNKLDLIIDSGSESGIHDPLFLRQVSHYQEWLNNQEYINKTTSIIDIFKQINKSFNQDSETYYKVQEDRESSAQDFLFYTMALPQGMDINSEVNLDQRFIKLSVFWNIQNSKKSLKETIRLEEYGKKLGLNVFATGQEYLFQGMNGYVVQAYFTSIFTSLILIAILMMVVFKSFQLGIISIFPNLVPILFGAGAMTLFSKPIDVGTVLVASVCFGIAIDDTIHFISEYSANKKSGLSIRDNIIKVFNNTGVALTSTTFILVGGFGVFAFADFVPNFNFGVFSAFVLFIALITDLLFLPAILVLIEKKKQ